MAASSASVAPALWSAINASAEVSSFPASDLILLTTTASAMPFCTSFRISMFGGMGGAACG
jgi:hypothetical protein